MYNHIQIEKFIEMVHKEASAEAQKVYDSYNSELNMRIQKSMLKGHKLHAGMGSVSIENSKGAYVAQEFCWVLCTCEYWDKVKAGFNIENYEK